jgi:hypothetical protein
MHARHLKVAALIGVFVTLLLLALAFWTDDDQLSRILFWHNTLIQKAIGGYNIGTPEEPVIEGTPVNLVAFLASIPLGFLIYGAIAYVVLCLIRRRT